MTQTARVRISWGPPEQGGRKRIPQGPIYSAPAQFDAMANMWSIVVELPEPNDMPSIVTNVRMLFPNAPAELLRPGSRFEIYEGSKLVGTGEVLP